MSRTTFKIAVLSAALCVVTSVAAQTQETATTKTTETRKSGVVETIYGNHVVLRDAEGTHEWTVPEGFQFQMDGQKLTVAQLQPGMKVDATTTAKTTIRDVTVTRNVTGTVAQVAPTGGIVVRDSSGRLTSFRAQDLEGKDLTILRPGRETPTRPQEISWKQLRVGDQLNATIVTTLPPQVVTKETTTGTVKPGAVGGSGPVDHAPTPPTEPGAK